ncbi:Pentatricopeptide repeat (PPR) superfamily protein [Raphanus sativus]|uniref:Pentatricopeptide repeat-containing protein At1g28020 n=1 Tax=Raphanus sativus TaxID=3726 RepID=A0A9W3CSQ5_RAPSA|nr:putative pentatricopeptide repeat-containing protein At1g28020 [Raphanus sativus]KAJ4869889.1 Pentatricopeptide repeat (PPR) superfamily protein [Raphanus sativus]
MMSHNLQHHARSILTHSSRTLLFCSYSNGTLPSSPRHNTTTLQSRIEAASEHKTAITRVLEHWRRQQKGKQINPSMVRVLVEELRDSQRFRQALEVSDWMIEHKLCNLIPEDFTARFCLIENVLGLREAEKFFESVPESQRGEAIYTALLNCYTVKKDLVKAEGTFKKMREIGLLLKPLPYNSMMSLYLSVRKRDKVDEIMQEMKENNVAFDSLTVNTALRVYASVSDLLAMEKLLSVWEDTVKMHCLTSLDMAKTYLRHGNKEKAREMLLRTEEDQIDPESYPELLTLYGEAGEREDVYRIWDLYKMTEEQDNDGFRALFGSLLKLDDLNGAEEIYYNEWDDSGLEFDVRIPTMLASGYRKNGQVKKADKLMIKTIRNEKMVRPIGPLLEEWGKKGNLVEPSYMRGLIKDLCDSKQYPKALEASTWVSERKLFDLFPEDYAARLHLIDNVLGLEQAEKFFNSSIPENMKNYSVYSTLLTTYTRSAKTVDKAEATFERMSELGFLLNSTPFNSMISLYSEIRKRSKVMKLLEKMKEKNIEPDNVTMNNVLRVNAYVSAMECMEKYKREWEEELRLEVRTLDAMAKAYETEGSTLKAIEITSSKKEVYRLWNEYKKDNVGKMSNEGYRSVIRSLLKLGDVQGAQDIFNEWEPERYEFDSRIPSLLISRYCEEEKYNEVKTRDVMKLSRKKRRGLQFELFKDVCVLFTATSFGVGFVPCMVWLCGGETITIWGSLGVVVTGIVLAVTNSF